MVLLSLPSNISFGSSALLNATNRVEVEVGVGVVGSILLEKIGDSYDRSKAGMWANDNVDEEQIMVVLLTMIMQVNDINVVEVV